MLKRLIVAAMVVLFVVPAFGDEPKSNTGISAISLQDGEKINIDGKLDETIYQEHKPQVDRALFYHEATGEKIPEGNETTIWLMHNQTGIYFAARLEYPSKEKMRMIKSRSTAQWTSWLETIAEDYVMLSVDLENSRQSGDQSFVIVNPNGATWVSISSGKTGRLIEEIKSGAVVVDNEVSVEVFLPFSLLIYQGEGKKTVAINFEMKKQYLDDASYRWCHAGPNNDPAKMGTTTLIFPKLKRNTDVFLDVSYIIDKKDYEFKDKLRPGMNVRQDITSDIKAVVAVNPDFGGVEEETQTINFSTKERFRSEKRPVLEEGGQWVRMGNDFYSRRITDVDAGLNSHGEIGPVRFGALGIYNRESERDFVFKSSLNTLGVQNSLGYILSQAAPDESTDQLLRYSLSKKWGAADFSANWVAFNDADGDDLASRGQTSLNFFPLGGRIGVSHFYTEKGLAGNRLGFYRGSTDTRGVSVSTLFEKVWEKTERGMGRHLRKVSTYHYAEAGDFMDGDLSQRFIQFRYWIQHQHDLGLRCILNLNRYKDVKQARKEYRNWELNVEPQRLFSTRNDVFKYAFGVNYQGGRQQEEIKHFWRPFCGIEWKTGIESRLKANLSYEVLRHIKDREQFLFEVNYDFSTVMGLGLRALHNGKEWIPYFAAWRKESKAWRWPSIYLTFGEPNPNAKKLNKKRFALKSESRFNFNY